MKTNDYKTRCYNKLILNNDLVEERSVFWEIALKIAYIQETDCPNISSAIHLILICNHVYPENMTLTTNRIPKHKATDHLMYFLNPNLNTAHYDIKNIKNKNRTPQAEILNKSSGNLQYDFLLNQGKTLIIKETEKHNCISFGCYEGHNIWLCKIVSIITNRKLTECLPNDKLKLMDNIELIHREIDPLTIKDIVCSYGTENLMVMIGAILESIKHKTVILIDNYQAATALLIAQQINDKAIDKCIFTNLSRHKCHKVILDFFEKKSILQLDYTSNLGESVSISKTLIDGALQWFSSLKSTL